MKHYLLTFIILLLIVKSASAQTSNAVIFTENGEKFTVILNGVRQNEEPETNVKITGLNAAFYKLKVIFNNPASGEKNFNLYINPGTETSYSIRKNSKGEYMIRLASEVPMAQAPAASSTQLVINYKENPAAIPQAGTIKRTSSTETTVQNTASTGTEVNTNNQGISIAASGTGTEEDLSQSQQQTQTVIHTTTTTTHTVSSHPSPVRPPSYVPGYTGEFGCPVPLSNEEFADVKTSISSKTFEDTRMTVAKQVLNDHCLVTSQVTEVMKLFTFEDNRLQFAKLAYGHTYDIGNYYKVNSAFTFENSIDDLNEYIDSIK